MKTIRITAMIVLAALFSVGPSFAQDNVREAALLEHASEPWTGDFDGMVERGFVRVLTAYNPLFLSFDGPTNSKRGLVVEVMNNFEKKLNKWYSRKGRPLDVVLIPVPRDELLPRLVEGQGDIAAANLTITPKRQAIVDFSDPFYWDVHELVITGPASPNVRNFEDLTELGLRIRKSSSYFEHLAAFNERREAEGKVAIPIHFADELLEDYDLLDMVNAGVIAAIVVDDHKAQLWAKVFDDIQVHETLAVNSGGRIAWAFRKGSPKLTAAVNRFAKIMRKGTLLGNILIGRYLRSTKWMENVLAPDARERFDETVRLIRKYAKVYDFDWLMLAAQGYQESRLDQSKRSPAGAIGIMQVMSRTAADPNVGIADIHLAENNVNAGVKYLRFLRDRYFNTAKIAPLDQVLFSFAAYNAGPAAIARARRRAEKLRLDPNVWFGNVEVAAARTISREPVVYVRNIYKYYVVYRRIAAVRAGRTKATTTGRGTQ